MRDRQVWATESSEKLAEHLFKRCKKCKNSVLRSEMVERSSGELRPTFLTGHIYSSTYVILNKNETA